MDLHTVLGLPPSMVGIETAEAEHTHAREAASATPDGGGQGHAVPEVPARGGEPEAGARDPVDDDSRFMIPASAPPGAGGAGPVVADAGEDDELDALLELSAVQQQQRQQQRHWKQPPPREPQPQRPVPDQSESADWLDDVLGEL